MWKRKRSKLASQGVAKIITYLVCKTTLWYKIKTYNIKTGTPTNLPPPPGRHQYILLSFLESKRGFCKTVVFNVIKKYIFLIVSAAIFLQYFSYYLAILAVLAIIVWILKQQLWFKKVAMLRIPKRGNPRDEETWWWKRTQYQPIKIDWSKIWCVNWAEYNISKSCISCIWEGLVSIWA